MMSREVAERCVALMESSSSSTAGSSNGSSSAAAAAGGRTVKVVDLTGGAPELTPQFRCGQAACPPACRGQLIHLVSCLCSLPVLLLLPCLPALPALLPACRYLVQEARRLGLEVIDRCNLTGGLAGGWVGLPPLYFLHAAYACSSAAAA